MSKGTNLIRHRNKNENKIRLKNEALEGVVDKIQFLYQYEQLLTYSSQTALIIQNKQSQVETPLSDPMNYNSPSTVEKLMTFFKKKKFTPNSAYKK